MRWYLPNSYYLYLEKQKQQQHKTPVNTKSWKEYEAIGRSIMCHTHFGKHRAIFCRIKYISTQRQERGVEVNIHKRLLKNMLMAGLFIIAIRGNNPNVYQQING